MQVTLSQGGKAFESADGKYLYFFSEDTNGLFRIPVGGGEEKQIAPSVEGGVYSVTAKGVYYFSDPKTLQFLNEKTGLIRTVARLEGHSANQGISVSPDDAYLVFSERANLRNELMIVEGFR